MGKLGIELQLNSGFTNNECAKPITKRCSLDLFRLGMWFEKGEACRRGQKVRAAVGVTIQNMQKVELRGLLSRGCKGKETGAPIECFSPLPLSDLGGGRPIFDVSIVSSGR